MTPPARLHPSRPPRPASFVRHTAALSARNLLQQGLTVLALIGASTVVWTIAGRVLTARHPDAFVLTGSTLDRALTVLLLLNVLIATALDTFRAARSVQTDTASPAPLVRSFAQISVLLLVHVPTVQMISLQCLLIVCASAVQIGHAATPAPRRARSAAADTDHLDWGDRT